MTLLLGDVTWGGTNFNLQRAFVSRFQLAWVEGPPDKSNNRQFVAMKYAWKRAKE